MPIVRIDMWEGRSIEQKRRLAREITKVFAAVAECDPSSVRVLITDFAKENWAVGGELQVDREADAAPPRRQQVDGL